MSQYLSENTKTGDFNQQRTLSGLFFVIPEHLASICAVVLAFTANKQTNTLNYIYRLGLGKNDILELSMVSVPPGLTSGSLLRDAQLLHPHCVPNTLQHLQQIDTCPCSVELHVLLFASTLFEDWACAQHLTLLVMRISFRQQITVGMPSSIVFIVR